MQNRPVFIAGTCQFAAAVPFPAVGGTRGQVAGRTPSPAPNTCVQRDERKLCHHSDLSGDDASGHKP